MVNIYPLLRPALFNMDAERSHDLALSTLSKISKNKTATTILKKLHADKLPSKPVEAMGITFPHPVGLAAGLDKNAAACNALAALGFAWVELGTVTPKPQPGNPKPRIFRLEQENAIINRMGFNGAGLDTFLANLTYADSSVIKGINIGKNAATPMDNAVDDYLLALRQVYSSADYVTINISSPNTKNLRELQQQEELGKLLSALANAKEELSERHQRVVPLVLKIAPDNDSEQLKTICELLRHYKIDGVAATNTTISRERISGHPLANENGGLSGKPLQEQSTNIIRQLYQHLQDEIPIIGIGGIHDAASAQEKIDAGAKLIQLYTGFVYQGPKLIADIVKSIQPRS